MSREISTEKIGYIILILIGTFILFSALYSSITYSLVGGSEGTYVIKDHIRYCRYDDGYIVSLCDDNQKYKYGRDKIIEVKSAGRIDFFAIFSYSYIDKIREEYTNEKV